MSEPCRNDGCGRPVDDAYVCQSCATILERELGDVRWLDGELDTVLARQTATGERMGRGGGEAAEAAEPGDGPGAAEVALPYDPRATEARYVLTNTVTTWARVVAEESPGARLPAFGGLGLVAAWLSSYAGFLRTHSAADEAFDELLSAIRDARRLIDVRPERVYAGPCEGADDETCGQDLYAKLGAPSVTCPACGARYDMTERRAWLLEAARDHLGTAREVVGIFGGSITADQLKGWVRLKKVTAKGSVMQRGRTVATYRVGDLMDASTVDRFDEREQRATKRAGRLG